MLTLDPISIRAQYALAKVLNSQLGSMDIFNALLTLQEMNNNCLIDAEELGKAHAVNLYSNSVYCPRQHNECPIMFQDERHLQEQWKKGFDEWKLMAFINSGSKLPTDA